MIHWVRRAAMAWLFLAAAGGTSAQTLPSEPVVLAAGRVIVGGNVSATFGPSDPGFFNYTDYEDSLLRLVRLDLTASVRAGRHVSLLGEVRSQNVRTPTAYALYARIRPWPERRFAVQIGRIPPTFGAFPRRSYEADNPLIGYPLAYQYLTSLRSDALPAGPDELLGMRGRGWLASYSVGNTSPAPGVPLASAFRWDTGVQAHVASDVVELTGSVTTGTLSNPRIGDDNAGRQVAGRLALRPIAGLVVGASAARGPFVSREAARAAVGGQDSGAFTQTALGTDVEYSRDYYLLRAETVYSRWTVPLISVPLRALATSVEGRYKLRPGLFVAARIEHLGFGEIVGSRRRAAWDAPVTRVEAGAGFAVQRNLLLKVAAQFDERDGGRIRRARLVAGQLAFWF